jgi:pimeloyl-ACP methyl ester carboxylesterase
VTPPRRQIHTLQTPGAASGRHPPLVFVHGGCVHAGCWAPHFLPYFSRRGFACQAIDLAGHGASEGRQQLDSFGIDDYADDVAQVVDGLDAPPILIGHSMGTVVVERYLERGEARGAVLMAPVPPSGIFGSTLRLALTTPTYFAEQQRAIRGEYTAQTLALMREVYYSADTPDDDLIRYAPLFQPESRRALTELTLLAMRFPRRRPQLPVLVVGGENDALFPPSYLGFTADRWAADRAVIPGVGHTMMLDAHWQPAAQWIADWLEERFG